ncbi:MAG: flagellar hook-length control protein FliK [Phreatobacter sp.]|uniref:flagellar hook-length control protein FliK n=1 Tax=Phreatobacter sp. TaxID=1966341 RepID=UPI001A5F3EC3|nr:flagellar hook-length control protein FliK [Phreatobacter sp.]MBL8571508.1 flagellar hook-length control protein FliK [Phreatobacter sp.]
MAASSTTATGSSQGVRTGDSAQRARSSREGGATSAFAEALDEQQRTLGEAEQDSRIARSRQQRRSTAQPEAISATTDSAVSRRLSDDKPVADDDAMAEATAGSDKPVVPTDASVATDAAKPVETKPAEGDQAAAVQQAAQQAPPAPVQTAAPAVATAEATPVAPTEAEIPQPVAAAAAPAPVAAQPMDAQAAPPAAEQATVAQPATAKPSASATAPAATPPTAPAPEAVAAAPEPQPEVKAAAKAEARPEMRADVRAEARPEAPAPQQQAAAPAAETAPPPAQAPASASPFSFAHEVAQKVAAQTQAAGSVVPVHALAVTIAARASTGSTRFDIKLDPPELGRIEVQMTLDREGRVKSRMVVEKQETLDLLQRDQRNLERTLAQAGLETTEGSIEFSLKDQGGNDRQGQGDRPARTWQAAVEDPDATATLAANAATYSRLAAARGGIDIRI